MQIDIETLTNDEYKNITSPVLISYGYHATIFGNCLIALVKDRICYLAFTEDKESSIGEIQYGWPNANLVENQESAYELINNLFAYPENIDYRISLRIKGTPFQIKTWKILLSIPFGAKVSYENIAEKAGDIKAVRAVANCIAKNNISFVIPCHRVIRKSGEIHKYRWGSELKAAMLTWEAGFLM